MLASIFSRFLLWCVVLFCVAVFAFFVLRSLNSQYISILLFLCSLFKQCFDGFEQWKRLVALICACDAATREDDDSARFFADFALTLRRQLSDVPTDFFIDALAADNFLAAALRSFCDAVDLVENDVDDDDDGDDGDDNNAAVIVMDSSDDDEDMNSVNGDDDGSDDDIDSGFNGLESNTNATANATATATATDDNGNTNGNVIASVGVGGKTGARAALRREVGELKRVLRRRFGVDIDATRRMELCALLAGGDDDDEYAPVVVEM
jgi:hypothetical protein